MRSFLHLLLLSVLQPCFCIATKRDFPPNDYFVPSTLTVSLSQNYSINNVSPLQILNDDVITVEFSTSQVPSANDWIGAYAPGGISNIPSTVPAKWGYCSSSPTYMSQGSGSIQFNMTNLRDDIAFYYFTGDTADAILVASFSETVSFVNINQPLRNRIVATGDPNTYKFLWSSNSSLEPVLRWGLSSGTYSQTAPAFPSNIQRSSLCGSPANGTGWRNLGMIYTASINGIVTMGLSNQYIYYSFGDASTSNWSPEFQFWVGPKVGENPPTRGTQLILMADLGTASYSTSEQTGTWSESNVPAAINTTIAVSKLMQQGQVDAIFHSGDISYANGYLVAWEFFMDMISPMAGGALYFTTVGNHESDWPDTVSNPGYGSASGGECSVVATTLLPMPEPATTEQPWWSYNVGLVHLVGMSTEHNFSIGSPQYLFLESDLQSVDRSVTPWIIFSGHRSMYVVSNDCCPGYDDFTCSECAPGSDVGVMQQLQASVEPLLHRYKVNLAFAGHFHDLQRQSAVYQGKLVQKATMIKDAEGNTVAYHDNPNATVWMVVGSAGMGFDNACGYYDWSEAVFDQINGFALVTAVNSTYLYWQLIDSATQQVIDRMAISQPSYAQTASPSSDSPWLTRGAIAGLVMGSFLFLVGAGTLIYNRGALLEWFGAARATKQKDTSKSTIMQPLISGSSQDPV